MSVDRLNAGSLGRGRAFLAGGDGVLSTICPEFLAGLGRGGGGGGVGKDGNAGRGPDAGSGVRAGLESVVVGRLRTPMRELPILGSGRGLGQRTGEVKPELMGKGTGSVVFSSSFWRGAISMEGVGLGTRQLGSARCIIKGCDWSPRRKSGCSGRGENVVFVRSGGCLSCEGTSGRERACVTSFREAGAPSYGTQYVGLGGGHGEGSGLESGPQGEGSRLRGSIVLREGG